MKGASSFDDKNACGKAAITCVKGCKGKSNQIAIINFKLTVTKRKM